MPAAAQAAPAVPDCSSKIRTRRRRELADRRDADDAVTAAVAGRHDERAIRSGDETTKAPVPLIHEDLVRDDVRAIDAEPAEVLLLERRDDERSVPGAPLVAGDECGAGHREAHAARAPHRISEAARDAARAEHGRPSEVRTGG